VTWAGAAGLMGSWAAAMLLAVLPLAPGSAAPLEATVLSWHEGDTLRVVLASRTGTRVRLELDVQMRDRYGGLLGYLWVPDSLASPLLFGPFPHGEAHPPAASPPGPASERR